MKPIIQGAISIIAAAACSTATAQITEVDINTPPSEQTGYSEGKYYFDATNASSEVYNFFIDVNKSVDNVPAGNAEALIEIGESSEINIGMWTWFNINQAAGTTSSYSSKSDFTGTVIKFNTGSDGSTGSITNLRECPTGGQNSSINSLVLLDFSGFDTSADASVSQDLFNFGMWSGYSGSKYVATIAGAQYELSYNGSTEISTADGVYTITLTESTGNAEYRNDKRWLTYDFSYSAIPEPSTYAAAFGAFAAALVLLRRKNCGKGFARRNDAF